ncbi:cold-regulated protein 27-like isoform X2 [Tasmannia lanceolata]|uniref:cold-regulated protein 27-like isoform X2 n=1 Tax=Tasmannia lanceolata TaxID=3420 RepID=UPI004063C2DB
MDENNLNQAMESNEEIGIRSSLETSGITGENSLRDLGLQMVESMRSEWTDEKHSLYLNLIEASFVEQLHNYDYRLMDSNGWQSRKQKLLDSKSSPSNANSRSSSGQFKVLRRGFWEKHNFEKAQTQLDTGNESRVLLANPWIQHFRSASSGKGLEVTSVDLQENSETVHLGGRKNETTTSGVPTSSKQHPACYSSMHRQDSVGSITEVSDQNFVDESFGCGEGKNLSSPCRKRKVVPFEKSPITPNPNKNHTLLREGKLEIVEVGNQSVQNLNLSLKTNS